MYRLLARAMVRRSVKAQQRRDVDALLKTYAKDVVFRFPGDNSWAGTFHGIDEVRPWLERFHRVGLVLEVEEIFVSGWPWDTRVALRFTDHLRSPDGEMVYENRGFIYGRSAWGKIHTYEVVEDTEKVAALDRWLEEHEPASA